MWFKEYDKYFCKIENFVYGEIKERSVSNHHPTMMESLDFIGKSVWCEIITFVFRFLLAWETLKRENYAE